MIRRHGSRPTIALWMLVAIADIALVVAAAGAFVVLLVVAGAMVVAGAVAGVRMQRRAVAGVLTQRSAVSGGAMVQRRAVPERESVLRRRA
jgi:hypothetical protein